MDFFLKSGIFGIAIILAFFALFVAGIIVIAITQSRRAAAIFGLLAFFPLILGLCGTLLGNLKVNEFVREHGHEMSPELLNHPQSVVAEGRREARIPIYMGATATAVLLVIAGCGGALTKKSNKSALSNR